MFWKIPSTSKILGLEQSFPAGEEKFRHARKNENLFPIAAPRTPTASPRRKRNGPGAQFPGKSRTNSISYPGGHSVSYLSPTGRPRTNSTGAC